MFSRFPVFCIDFNSVIIFGHRVGFNATIVGMMGILRISVMTWLKLSEILEITCPYLGALTKERAQLIGGILPR